MAQVIIVRLVPKVPTSGADFSGYLTNLSIKAFDLSFGDSIDGLEVGEAKGAWLPNAGLGATGPAFSPATQRILQHATIYPVQVAPFPAPPVGDVRLEAVATAIIELTTPPATEFDTSDLRLEIRQGTELVSFDRITFNVAPGPATPLSNNPSTYIGAQPPAIVATLPDPVVALDPNSAYVELPQDGSAPKFAILQTAIEKVLAKDPAAGAMLATVSPLSIAQARQVAREITWNRQVKPQPVPPDSKRLEDLYTRPPTDTSWSNDDRDRADMDRQQYEAGLTGYYAIQDANSDRLAQYVFALSAGVWSEQRSTDPGKIGLTFPIKAGAGAATSRHAQAVVEDAGALKLDFEIPAQYFYALSSILATSVSAQDRYKMATSDNEDRTAATIAAAIDTGVIVAGTITPQNAARRLTAIGQGDALHYPLVTLDADVSALVTAWLAEMGASIDPFWSQAPFPAAIVPGHLDLVLAVVTQQTTITANSTALIAGIKAIPVADVDQLQALTVQQWRTFFLPANVTLLPDFTNPGTPDERVDAFVRQLRKYFEVQSIAPPSPAGSNGDIEALPIASGEPFAKFFAADPGFAFPIANWNAPAITTALEAAFPGDAGAQAWLLAALQTIDQLLRATSGVGPGGLQFSLLEALYARGFTSCDQIQALSGDEFAYALTGTIAYPYAAAIQTAAGGSIASGTPAPGSFMPINPDGSLINCIPPWHLSPLGPVEYLHELLQTGVGTSCDHPAATGATLGSLVADRRGALGGLHATAANVHTALPLIDLVNECLEALVATGMPGAVHDTNGTSLGGHDLLPADGSHGEGHVAATLFGAIPEHSSPATPVDQFTAYDKLAQDFTSPVLPYAQPLDISRSYLRAMGTSRFATMRTFREDITEFAIDAAEEATDFQRDLWRYPVRIELALEYLGLSAIEYQALYVDPIDGDALSKMYGFATETVDGVDWKMIVARVPEFIRRTGIDYCAFIELWSSGFVKFSRQTQVASSRGEQPPGSRDFPDCEPCCPEDLVIAFDDPADPETALYELLIFIRLWRKLRCLDQGDYGFAELRDICQVLALFNATTVNPDFIRQLVAFQVLRDEWQLDLGIDRAAPAGSTGAARTRLLGLWNGVADASLDWAIAHLLNRIEDRAEREHAPGRLPGSHRRRRPPEFMKLLRDNLDILSSLGGFDPAITPWNAHPTCTLRLAEIMAKIYSSRFTTGELLFLFSVDQHLDGDDPFYEQDDNEALDQPLDLPEEGHPNDLWHLRARLLEVDPSEEEIEKLSWSRILAMMRTDFGYDPPTGSDWLAALGEHFFPETLAHAGLGSGPKARQYRTALATTTVGLWNAPHARPYQYDDAAKELVTWLPLRNEDVLAKLNSIEQLGGDERKAVQQLYFAPRAELARFGFLFPSLAAAERALIEEEDEGKRWRYFRRSFARFAERAHVIARHLAEHVGQASGSEAPEPALASLVLRRLLGDENQPGSAWEDSTGASPAAFQWEQPTGGAFAALSRLTGTGLFGTIDGDSGSSWPEMRGPITVFTPTDNQWNAPVPTIIPDLDLSTPSGYQFALIRNGLALRERDGAPLAGAEGFTAHWSGVLIIERGGSYTFFAGAPTDDPERPDFERCGHSKWRVNLRRGQKTFHLLNHRWVDEEAPDRVSGPLHLKRGAYFIDIDFAELPPEFDEKLELFRACTGFTVKYQGPDTDDCVSQIPLDRLYRDVSPGPLASQQAEVAAASDYLALQYTGSLRDIRRTYQRAFKALLFAHRLALSAHHNPRANVSELEYMLSAPALFAGATYVPGSPYTSHKAGLDFNLLPVGDTYKGDPERTPPAAFDARAAPTMARRQALFDWFERQHDYTAMRDIIRRRCERQAWLCFVEAANQQPIDPIPLLMDLGIDMDDANLVLTFETAFSVGWTQLLDDRWAIRVWRAATWVARLERSFVPLGLSTARPDLWAGGSDAELASGNAILTKFFCDGMIERGEPRRYADIAAVNNGLRERARCALLAYLVGLNRVALPFASGRFATSSKDLSALLLIDVEIGLCEKASRVEEAVTAVQSFVERARLSLEPSFIVTADYAMAWEKRFATFRLWQACRRREIYRENVVEWVEHARAIKTEAFRFLETSLRGATLSAPRPGGMEYWPKPYWPHHPSLTLSHEREPALIRQVSQPENLGLMGWPERHARKSWLAPSQVETAIIGRNPTNDQKNPVRRAAATRSAAIVVTNSPPGDTTPELPLWLQAAVRLGTRFLRVAAAATPSATSSFIPSRTGESSPCCCECGVAHPPVVDEYYFWLRRSDYYNPATLNPAEPTIYQDADWGATSSDMTSDWHRSDKLPQLLLWKEQPMVRLAWCRVHNGEFQPPRFTDDGAHADPATGEPQLEFLGREGDSLKFSITNAAPLPVGYLDPSPWGFRYDIASDTAVVLPEVVATPAPTIPFPALLQAYPFFVYFEPGAPLEPSLFSTVMASAGALRMRCQYEAALKWYEMFYAPTDNDLRWATCCIRQTEPNGNGTQTPGGNPAGNAPGTPGNNDPANPTRGSRTANTASPRAATPTMSEADVNAIAVPSRNPRSAYDPCCDTMAKTTLVARQRGVLLDFLETMLDFARSAMCRNSPEGYAVARLRLDALWGLIGERPVTIFGQDDGLDPQTVAAFVPRFPSLNPRLMEIYDRATDELDTLHQCQTRARLTGGTLHRDTSYWGDDPTRQGWRAAETGCVDDGCCCPPSPYRFTFLLQRALEVTGEVRALGSELLGAFEKGDAEFLAAMRAGHERQVQNLTEEIRNLEFREADWQVQALQKSKESAQAKRQYYADLIANGLIPKEQAYENLTSVSMAVRSSGNVVEAVGETMNLIPDNTTGVAGIASTPVSVFQMPIGTKLAHVFAAAARILTTVSDINGTQSSLALTESGWDRREADWVFQVTDLDIEIQQIERQILAAERRRDTALRQFNIHLAQKEQAAEVHDFLRDKFTSDALYLYLQEETAALLREMFEIAWCWAVQAQRAFQLERDLTTRTFLPTRAWDNLHEATLAGDRLAGALRAMEKAYHDENCRPLELTTKLSLRLDFPLAFLQLKTTGKCEIDIPEWRFDREYPGHYLRRIKSLGLTIPAVAGPYSGVHCTLTLLSSQTRIDPSLLDVQECCPGECTCGCCGRRRYESITNDPRIVKRYGALDAIATSSGQNDTGLFQFDFRDERYLPFEYAGAVSRWRIELPFETNSFDLETVTDVVLQLNYTAREGGEPLRRASWAAASCLLPGGGFRLFEWRQDFADAWQRFKAIAHERERFDCPLALGLSLSRSMFPFLAGARPVRVRRVEIWFEARMCDDAQVIDLEFVPNDDSCCERYLVTCLASADWPCLYHGVLDYPSPPLRTDRPEHLGEFRFPEEVVDVERAYLICSYEAGPPERCIPRIATCEPQCVTC